MLEVLEARAQEGVVAPRYTIHQDELRGWVERFARPRHFASQKEENKKVCDEISALFKEWGYEVAVQGSYRNVLALPKSYNGAPLVLVGAHYDSVPTTPGADDNASALAALLSCAKHLSTRKHPPHAAFVAFNCEEDGMLGSADFVRAVKRQGFPQISRTHVLEMLGYATKKPGSQQRPASLPIELPDVGDFLAVIGDTQSGVDEIINKAKTATPDLTVMGLRVTQEIARALPVLHRSDHASFWAYGYSATFWTDTAEYRNPHYHQPTDTPDTIDYAFLQRATELLLATLS